MNKPEGIRRVRLAGLLMLGTVLACSESPTRQDEETIDGFRIVSGTAVVFEWHFGDSPAADTMLVQPFEPVAVRFVWLDDADELAAPTDATLEVTIAPQQVASWVPHPTIPFAGSFDPGPFEEIEGTMRIRLLDEDTILATPALQIHVGP